MRVRHWFAVLLAACVSSVLLTAQPSSSEAQKISEFRAWLKAIEPRLTSTGVTNARSISTRLGTLSTQFKLTAPVDAVLSNWSLSNAGEWSACVAGTQTRSETWTRTVLQPAQNGGTTGALSETRTGTQSCTPPVSAWTFSAKPDAITAGQSAALSFTTTTTDVHNVAISGLRPSLAPCIATGCSGTLLVSPTVTTTYVLRSENSSRVAYPPLSVTVTVSGEPPKPAEICGNGIDDDKDGQIDEGCDTPPSTDSYFETLKNGANVQLAVALNTPQQVDQYAQRGGYTATVAYDPNQNAAKWQWPTNGTVSAEFLKFPISLVRPASGSSSLLIIEDDRWDIGWLTEYNTTTGKIEGNKWRQITDATSPGSARQGRGIEPNMRGIGLVSGVVSYFGLRAYKGVSPPGSIGVASCPGFDRMFDTALPMTCFAAKPDVWTRFWTKVTLTAGTTTAKVSMWAWAADQDAPVRIFNELEVGSAGAHLSYEMEYNSSYDVRIGGPMAAYARNLLVLKDADPVLQKPVK